MRATYERLHGLIHGFTRTVGLVAVLAVAALGQQLARTTEPAKDIVRGTVVTASQTAIEVRDAKGVTHRVIVNPTTLVLTDDEDFSVANLPDIELQARDLEQGDRVEVVVDSDQTRLVAGIVTRLSPIDATTTARSRP